MREHLDAADVVLLPVGSTEQHGPHLPLGTASLTAIGLAADAAYWLLAPWSLRRYGIDGAPPPCLPRPFTLVPEHLTDIARECIRVWTAAG